MSFIAAALCLPFIRYVWWLGDEGVVLHGAERILRGDRIYLDFFEFLPPGSFAIAATWFSITGMSLLSARALAILTTVGIACFTYLACRQASRCAHSSAFIALGWVIISQGNWTQISHHWFTTLLSMVAAWMALTSIEHPRPWLWGPLIAGFAAGAALTVTPSRGGLTMLAAATPFLNLRRHRSEFALFLIGTALIPASTLIWLAAQGAVRAAFEDVILFAVFRYASIQPVSFGLWGNLQLKLLFPFSALVTLLLCARDRQECLRDPMFRTCAALGLAGFIGCFPRADGPHIAFAAPLVCPLLASCMGRFARRWAPRYRYLAIVAATAFLFSPALSLLRLSYAVLHGNTVSVARGRVIFGERGARELVERIAATPPRDGFLFYPYMPMLPFLTARRQVSRYDVFTPHYTLPSQYQEACVSAMRDASWLVIDRIWTDPKFLLSVFPAMRDAEPPETKRFERALETGFEFVAREGNLELRRRVRNIDGTVCSGIAR